MFDTKEYQAKYRAAHREKNKAYAKQYNKDNKQMIAKKRAIFYALNKEKRIKATVNWQKRNKAAVNAKNKAYKVSKKQRMPKWLTQGDKIEIQWAYQIAVDRTKETGTTYEVDHIVPLQGKIVSGLHVPWNLQVITGSENNKKNNKFGGL